jgi:hypothetical protein
MPYIIFTFIVFTKFYQWYNNSVAFQSEEFHILHGVAYIQIVEDCFYPINVEVQKFLIRVPRMGFSINSSRILCQMVWL